MPDRLPGARKVVVVGALPPPVHGMSLVTREVARRLVREAGATVADISPGSLERGAAYHLTKARKVARALLALARHAASGPRSFYLPCDSRWGLLYTAALAGAARLAGYRVVLHHHSYAYIVAPDRRMRLAVAAAGARATHVLLCADMAARFGRLYPGARQRAIVANAAFIAARPLARRAAREDLRIGHLGNLSTGKGLDLLLDLFRRLRRTAPAARLVLAGPPETAADARTVAAARSELGESLDYRGPVAGEGKERFYDDVDAFVFPSRSTEAQPLVLLEAMSRGVPAIAHARGCVGDLLGAGDGGSIPCDADFVASAGAILDGWIRDREALSRASRRARERFDALRATAVRDYDALVALLTGGPS